MVSDVLEWIEQRIWMIPLYPREMDYDVLANTKIDEKGARWLGEATDSCWKALQTQDAQAVGKAMTQSFEAQISMFPNMVTPDILAQIDFYKKDVFGWKVSGAGGGGYLIFFSEKPIENAIQIRIRRN
jgi:galactokinase/mevalonate kinase-like predicted kinase